MEQIAMEKAGIIKPGGRVVLYPEQPLEARRVVEKTCKEQEACLYVPSLERVTVQETSLEGTVFTAAGVELRTPFLGEHQVKNAVTALEVIRVLGQRGFSIPEEGVKEGFAKAFLPARMEIISRKPLCLLDGGHNPGCAKALREALEAFVPQRKVAVIGMMADKDSHEALRILGPLFSRIVAVTPDNPRALPAEKLRDISQEFCPDTAAAQTCGEALALAMKDITPKDALVVCGSFFLAGEIREQLRGKMENFKFH